MFSPFLCSCFEVCLWYLCQPRQGTAARQLDEQPPKQGQLTLSQLTGSKAVLKELLQQLAPTAQEPGLNLCVALVHMTSCVSIPAYVPCP